LEGPSMAYTGREGLEPSKFLRGRGLRPRPRSSEDQQRIQAMRREIERDFDAIGEKIEGRHRHDAAAVGGAAACAQRAPPHRPASMQGTYLPKI
jgi:hypothetical protein